MFLSFLHGTSVGVRAGEGGQEAGSAREREGEGDGAALNVGSHGVAQRHYPAPLAHAPAPSFGRGRGVPGTAHGGLCGAASALHLHKYSGARGVPWRRLSAEVPQLTVPTHPSAPLSPAHTRACTQPLRTFATVPVVRVCRLTAGKAGSHPQGSCDPIIGGAENYRGST